MMTTDPKRPVPGRKPSPQPVFKLSAALFVAIFGLLTFQLARGEDPALGPRAATGQSVERQDVTGPAPPAESDSGSGRTESSGVPSAPAVTESS